MFRKITVLGLFATSALALAVPDAHAVYINGKWYAKGVQETGKVWYDTVFAGTNPPAVGTEVIGITAAAGVPMWELSSTVDGSLVCTQKVCIRSPDKPECRVPGGAQGTPYQVQSGSFSVTLEATDCLVKGQKGTCKVLGYDHILFADVSDTRACPGGFVPDFSPDPFIGRTSTCDVSSGILTYVDQGSLYPKPVCDKQGQISEATVLCQFVSGHPGTIGEPYAIQVEIPNDGTIISTDAYAELGCTAAER